MGEWLLYEELVFCNTEYATKVASPTIVSNTGGANSFAQESCNANTQPINYTIKTLKESFLKTSRLDSEYYQTKYEQNEHLIKHYRSGYCTLKDLITSQSSGFAFSSDDYLESGDLALIRINNIKNANLDMSNAVYIPNEKQDLSPKDKVKAGDILISMSGSVGMACLVRDDINAMVNQRILKISINNFSQDVLVLILNSLIAKLQFERMGTGGVQTNLSNKDIFEIFIPLLSKEIQQTIESKIIQSFALRTEAKILLEKAKAKVECAIADEL